MAIQSIYLRPVFEKDFFQRTVDSALKAAESLVKNYQIDSVAFSGTSGAAMAFILSYKLGLHLMCVRKKTDTSHFHEYYRKRFHVEGNLDSQRYLIVDDFMDTGTTIENIIDAVKSEAPQALCMSILFYARSTGYTSFIHRDPAVSIIPITYSMGT
jgi:adenine/guanine phosphoribosyltransferase-like PRPP-binding protein